MEIRKVRMDEVETVLQMYEVGRQFMRNHGNDAQWIHGYPGRDTVEGDIQAGNLYFCVENGEPAAVFMYDFGEDPNYAVIDDGAWPNDKPYGVIHRIASLGTVKGAASYCMNWGFAQCGNLRVDTHEKNIPMQNMVKKNGFVRCGIVYMQDGSPRVAFQKTAE